MYWRLAVRVGGAERWATARPRASVRCGCDPPDPPPGLTWHRAIDTSLESPADIMRGEDEQHAVGSEYRAEARSVVVLEAHEGRRRTA